MKPTKKDIAKARDLINKMKLIRVDETDEEVKLIIYIPPEKTMFKQVSIHLTSDINGKQPDL